ncbi:hypothetical protein DMB35_20585 [Acinetobacter baumannii A424]|nr:hypothetical protein DMB35_20585 [Acinetobacter baumannii A424]
MQRFLYVKHLTNCVKSYRPWCLREIKVDLSLLPRFEYRDEFILWLTNFIRNISVQKKVRKTKVLF